jgi:hypothetical protein
MVLILLIFVKGSMGAKKNNFGELTIRINSGVEEDYNIERALLYRNVSLTYDTTTIVQNEDGLEVFYYPQLEEGEENVLRLISYQNADSSSHFYDLFINLGDSIPENLILQNASDLIFFVPDGQIFSNTLESRNITGKIIVNQNSKSEAVSGNFDLEFEYSLSKNIEDFQEVHLSGSFDVPVGKYEETSLATEANRKSRESKYKKNVYSALIISIFIIAIFGLR